jgi:lactate dehydrogenase-like 2-hydroxyacid dehydrogenase
MKVLVVMPSGSKDGYAPITEAGHELVFGTAESSRAIRPSDYVLIPLAAGANCMVFNEGSRHAMESLPNLTTCVATGLGYDKIDVVAATELGIVVCNTPTPLQS